MPLHEAVNIHSLNSNMKKKCIRFGKQEELRNMKMKEIKNNKRSKKKTKQPQQQQ